MGAEPKKVAILSGLGVVAAYVLYSNVFSSTSVEAPRKAAAATAGSLTTSGPPPTLIPGSTKPPARRSLAQTRGVNQEFRATFKRAANAPDLTTLDPTLRLDLLARVQGVERGGGERNLFQFASAPPPPEKKVDVGKIVPKPGVQPGNNQGTLKPTEPAKPPPPPITLKFYGYSTLKADGQRRAFFLDGEDIFVAGEGELIKKRYKVLRIGINSAIVEDTQYNNQQTIMIQKEETG